MARGAGVGRGRERAAAASASEQRWVLVTLRTARTVVLHAAYRTCCSQRMSSKRSNALAAAMGAWAGWGFAKHRAPHDAGFACKPYEGQSHRQVCLVAVTHWDRAKHKLDLIQVPTHLVLVAHDPQPHDMMLFAGSSWPFWQ